MYLILIPENPLNLKHGAKREENCLGIIGFRFQSKEIEKKEKEFPLNVRNTDNVCPQDERFREVIEMNEPTDSEAQETVPTGNELEEGYVPSSNPIGDE